MTIPMLFCSLTPNAQFHYHFLFSEPSSECVSHSWIETCCRTFQPLSVIPCPGSVSRLPVAGMPCRPIIPKQKESKTPRSVLYLWRNWSFMERARARRNLELSSPYSPVPATWAWESCERGFICMMRVKGWVLCQYSRMIINPSIGTCIPTVRIPIMKPMTMPLWLI